VPGSRVSGGKAKPAKAAMGQKMAKMAKMKKFMMDDERFGCALGYCFNAK
jgi:hypothetical protein